MDSFYKELYYESIDDIKHLMLLKYEFQAMYRRHIYDSMGDSFKEMILETEKAIKRYAQDHNKQFQDRVNLRMLENIVTRRTMKKTDAEIIINAIEDTKYRLNKWESDFINSVINSQYVTLTERQAIALNTIYEKATGAGRWAKRQVI